MTLGEFLVWLDGGIKHAEEQRTKAEGPPFDSSMHLIWTGYRDAYEKARKQAERIEALR